MRPLHEGEEGGGIVEVHAEAETAPRHRGKFYRFARRSGCLTGERMAQSIFNQLSQRLACLMGEALGRSEELVIETNRCTHMSEHMRIASICQLGIGLMAITIQIAAGTGGCRLLQSGGHQLKEKELGC